MRLTRQGKTLLKLATQPYGRRPGQRPCAVDGVNEFRVHVCVKHFREGFVRHLGSARTDTAGSEPDAYALGFARKLRQNKRKRGTVRAARGFVADFVLKHVS